MALEQKKAETPATAAAASPIDTPTPSAPEQPKPQPQPSTTAAPREKVTYHCVAMEAIYLFGRGYGPDKKILPPFELRFHDHIAEIDDPDLIAEVESHAKFNIEFRRIASQVVIQEAKYAEGAITTANAGARRA